MINNESYYKAQRAYDRAQRAYDNQTPYEPCKMKCCPTCHGEGEVISPDDGKLWIVCPECEGECEVPMSFDDIHEDEQDRATNEAQDRELFPK